ncbi:MAG: T9SS type A sorting domain-containing protein [Vicingaceae bacterium]
MLRFLTLQWFLVILLFSNPVYGQWEEMGRLSGGVIYGLLELDSSVLVSADKVYKTSDQGKTWETVKSYGRLSNLIQIDTFFIAERSGEYCRYYFQGDSSIVELNACASFSSGIIDALWLDSSLVLCTGAGHVFYSLDTLKTLTQSSYIPAWGNGFEGLDYNKKTGLCYGGMRNGDILMSIDFGKNWTSIPKSSPVTGNSCSDIIVLDSTILVANHMGVYSTYLDTMVWKPLLDSSYSGKGGATFCFTSEGIFCLIRDIGSLDESGYELILTKDTGKTWSKVGMGMGLPLNARIFEMEDLLIYGMNGVYASADTGKNWSYLSSFPGFQVIEKVVSFKGSLFALNGGKFNYTTGMFYSKDNGVNWESKNEGIALNEIKDIGVRGQKLLALTRYQIYSLAHPDSSWEIYTNIGGESFSWEDSVLILSRFDSIWVSSDDGSSWTKHASGMSFRNKVYLLNETVFALSQELNANMSFSEDFGANWTSVYDSSFIFSFGFLGDMVYDGEYYYANVWSNGPLRSKDKLKWDSVNTGLEPFKEMYEFELFNDQVIGVTHDNIYLSDDHAQSWRSMRFNLPDVPNENKFRSMEFHENYLYLAGNSIWRRPMSLIGFESIDNSNDEPQIYPNPNDGEFYLNFKSNQSINIEIFNVTGRMIYKTWLNQGNTMVNLPAQTAPGLYVLHYYSNQTYGTIKFVRK